MSDTDSHFSDARMGVHLKRSYDSPQTKALKHRPCCPISSHQTIEQCYRLDDSSADAVLRSSIDDGVFYASLGGLDDKDVKDSSLSISMYRGGPLFPKLTAILENPTLVIDCEVPRVTGYGTDSVRHRPQLSILQVLKRSALLRVSKVRHKRVTDAKSHQYKDSTCRRMDL